MTKSLGWQIYSRTMAILDAGWCCGHFATDSGGEAVPVLSDRARHFCAVGALERAQAELGIKLIKLSGKSAERWMALNDQQGKEAVQRLIRIRMTRAA